MDSFWEWFLLILIFLPLAYFWGFACVDLFTRKDLSGWMKALWLFVIIFMPILGVLIYFIFRPVTAQDMEAAQAYAEERDTALFFYLGKDFHPFLQARSPERPQGSAVRFIKTRFESKRKGETLTYLF